MIHEKRRLVAYIAHRWVSGGNEQNIYDHSTSSNHIFTGQLSQAVSIHDHSRNCAITGTLSDRNAALYDHGSSSNINLTLSGQTLNGYDHESQQNFTINVNGRSVSLYDHEDGKSYIFSV